MYYTYAELHHDDCLKTKTKKTHRPDCSLFTGLTLNFQKYVPIFPKKTTVILMVPHLKKEKKKKRGKVIRASVRSNKTKLNYFSW